MPSKSGSRDDVRDARLRLLSDIGAGAIAPGDDVVISRFAHAHNWSATTVREAVRLLAGEGVVTERMVRGFWIPIRQPSDLRAFYSASAMLCFAMAAHLGRAGRSGAASDYSDLPFAALREASRQPGLIAALRPVDATLLPYRRLERRHCADWAEEEAAFAEAVGAGDRVRLRALLEQWHARRAGLAERFCEPVDR